MSSRTPGKVCATSRETSLSREGNIASVIHRPYQMLSSAHTLCWRAGTLFPYTPFYFPYKEIKCSLVNCPILYLASLGFTSLIHKPPSEERKGVEEGK